MQTFRPIHSSHTSLLDDWTTQHPKKSSAWFAQRRVDHLRSIGRQEPYPPLVGFVVALFDPLLVPDEPLALPGAATAFQVKCIAPKSSEKPSPRALPGESSEKVYKGRPSSAIWFVPSGRCMTVRLPRPRMAVTEPARATQQGSVARRRRWPQPPVRWLLQRYRPADPPGANVGADWAIHRPPAGGAMRVPRVRSDAGRGAPNGVSQHRLRVCGHSWNQIDTRGQD
jgi:hypothetical protein